MSEFKFDYDCKYDTLFFYCEDKKTKSSAELGDLILDFDSNKNLVAIEILNATEFINKFTPDNTKITKTNLSELEDYKIKMTKMHNQMFIKIVIRPKNENEVIATIAVPRIEHSSPILAYN